MLFDFDGTLADTKPGIIATATKVLREWGMTDEEIGDPGRLIGPPFPRAYTMIYGVSEADADELCRRYRAEYAKLGREAYGLFDGIEPLLRDLRRQGRRARGGLVQARGLRQAHAFRGRRGRRVRCGDRPDRSGARRQGIAHLRCARRAGLLARRGRDGGGIAATTWRGARANGVPCIGVLFGTATRRELEDAGAAAIVTSVAELRARAFGVGLGAGSRGRAPWVVHHGRRGRARSRPPAPRREELVAIRRAPTRPCCSRSPTPRPYSRWGPPARRTSGRCSRRWGCRAASR